MPWPADTWATGEPYERYVGRWSRLVAPQFVAWLDVPEQSSWLDVGCGTGALCQTILDAADPARVVGVDASDGFIEHARRTIGDDRAEFHVGDARSLPVPDDSVDAAVSGLVLNFVPEPGAAAGELRRATRPGGTVGAYVWDYEDGMQLMRHFWAAAVELDRQAADLAEGVRFPLCRPDALQALFEDAGLTQVEATAIEIPTVFRDFDDYWSPFLGGQGPAPSYVASLDETQRERLAARIHAQLPTAPDGTIALAARAWAVRGVAA